MMLYARDEDLTVTCPTCKVDPPVACAGSELGPLVHERRTLAAERAALVRQERTEARHG